MGKTKFYVAPYDEELVQTEKSIKEYMCENGITELEVYETERVNDTGYFFCRDSWEVGERGYCGNQCKQYSPRNGKSGICKHLRQLFGATDKKVLIKI